jgi:tRNA (guanine-N7-)-methyltransferase
VTLLTSRLVEGGRLSLATDWEDYAEWMLKVLQMEAALFNEAGSGFAPRSGSRPITRFEARGQRLGHGVWDLAYLKVSAG